MSIGDSVTRTRGLGLLVAASVLLSGCANVVSGSALRDERAVPMNVPPLRESQLDDLLLSVDELNSIAGSTAMELALDLDEMSETSRDVSDPECLGALFGAEHEVYGDDWTAVRDQVIREPGDDKDHWTEQTVVLYPSERQAAKFVADSAEAWAQCGGFSVSIDDHESSYIWQLDPTSVQGDYVTQTGTQEDSDGWECQHALVPVSNVVVETWACAYGIRDEAIEMARRIVANALKPA